MDLSARDLDLIHMALVGAVLDAGKLVAAFHEHDDLVRSLLKSQDDLRVLRDRVDAARRDGGE